MQLFVLWSASTVIMLMSHFPAEKQYFGGQDLPSAI